MPIGDQKWNGKLVSCVDSGAARSVCPPTFGSTFPITDNQRDDTGFQTADGTKVRNLGSRVVSGLTNSGQRFNMKYAVADIAVALDSVSQICDGGGTVTFTRTGGWIERPGGSRTHFVRDGDTYLREVWIPASDSKGFTRPNLS